MTDSVKTEDTFLRQKIAVASMPAGPNIVLSASFTIAPNSVHTLISTVTPGYSNLSLFDFMYSSYIDTAAAAYLFPNGSSLTPGQYNGITVIDSHVEWRSSSDITNTRVYKVSFRNTDTVAHTIYFYLKAYTFASVTGGIA